MCTIYSEQSTTEQFTAAYKRLLTRSHIEGGKGNCEQRDPIEILSAIGDSSKANGKSVTIATAALIRKYDLQQRVPMQCDHGYSDAPNIVKLSKYKTAAISYISGYVAKSVQQKILCDDCHTALGSQDNISGSFFGKDPGIGWSRDAQNLGNNTNNRLGWCSGDAIVILYEE